VLNGAADGDGTIERPFGTISEALPRAAAGTIVAVGKGVYEELIDLPAGVTLWGACVAETELRSAQSHVIDGVIQVESSGGVIRNLGIGASPRSGVWVAGEESQVTVQDVRVVGVSVVGLGAGSGGTLVAERVLIQDVEGRAINANAGGNITVNHAVVEDSGDMGAFCGGEKALLVLHDAAIRRSRGIPGVSSMGRGANVELGGVAVLERVVLEENRSIGLFVAGSGAHVTLKQSVIRDTRLEPVTGSSRGVLVFAGASATLEQVLLDRNVDYAVGAWDYGTKLSATDLVVRNTRSRPDNRFGRGIGIEASAEADLHRVHCDSNEDGGVVVFGTRTIAHIEDLVVRDTQPNAQEDPMGRGLIVQDSRDVTVHRALFERNHDTSVFIAEDARARLYDLRIHDTLPDILDLRFGRGIQVQSGSDVEVHRAVLRRNRDTAVVASGPGTRLLLQDVHVHDTSKRACADSHCREYPFGMGLGSYREASLTAESFSVAGSELCGVFLALGGQMNLQDGLIEQCSIGACMNDGGYDLSRLSDGVVYRDNMTSLESTSLPVPDASSSVSDVVQAWH